jgi:hypothetical protein
MNDSEQKLRQAMMKIAEVAQAAVDNGQYTDEDTANRMATARRPHTHVGGKMHCSIKQPRPFG